MRGVTHVKAHDRRLPQKSPEYIARNLALMTRKEDQEAFLRRHGVKTVGTDDPRLAAPIPTPANGSARYSKSEIEEQAIGLAQMHGVV